MHAILSRAARVVLVAAALGAAASTEAPAQGPMSSTAPDTRPPPVPPAAPASGSGTLDVHKLFASTCGWCHSSGGRAAGKGPQLMGTALTDEQIVTRLRNGKPGAMPAFGASFSDEQVKAIVAYIRSLKPEGAQ